MLIAQNCGNLLDKPCGVWYNNILRNLQNCVKEAVMSQEKKDLPREAAKLRDRDLDDFWDIGRLLPNSSPKPKYSPAATRQPPEAVEIEVPPATRPAPRPVKTVMVPPTGSSPLSFSHEEKKVADHADEPMADGGAARDLGVEFEYVPDSNLLHKVSIYQWSSNYHYFEQFTKDAEIYAGLAGKETAHEPFFSYFPQYAQLNRRQRAWYLYWRGEVRKDNYLQTDYAYILLYLFELINLPADGENAESHRDQMAKVWVAYRQKYPQLDHYACEWLCDYCLIHKLSAPVLHLLPALGQIIATARLKEFYLSAMISVGDESVNVASAKVLLSHSCQYDYRKSKFYSGEHKALFDAMIPRALAAVFPLLLTKETGKDANTGSFMQDSKVTRDAYVGALCAHGNKRKIEVSYVSFSRSHDLRFMVGDMVRHIENRIRASILVRSKLTVNFLTVPLKKALDTWLDAHLPSPEVALKKAEMNQPRPAYEALYDLPHTEVSITSADEIEQSSWETTKILVEAFAEDEDALLPEEPTVAPSRPPVLDPIEPISVSPSLPEDVVDSEHSLLAVLGERQEFLRAVFLCDRAGQKAYCAAHKKLPDAVVDEINDLAAEHEIYDVIIEEDGRGGYQVIEDYRDTVEEMLQM